MLLFSRIQESFILKRNLARNSRKPGLTVRITTVWPRIKSCPLYGSRVLISKKVVSLNLHRYESLSVYFFIYFLNFGLMVCGILVPDQGLNLGPLYWKHGILTTGPPGKSSAAFPFKGYFSFKQKELRVIGIIGHSLCAQQNSLVNTDMCSSKGGLWEGWGVHLEGKCVSRCRGGTWDVPLHFFFLYHVPLDFPTPFPFLPLSWVPDFLLLMVIGSCCCNRRERGMERLLKEWPSPRT